MLAASDIDDFEFVGGLDPYGSREIGRFHLKVGPTNQHPT